MENEMLGAVFTSMSGRAALALTLLFPASVFGAAEPDEHLSLNVNLSAESFQNAQERSVFMGPTLDLINRHRFDENIQSSIDVAAELFTGSAVGIYPIDILGQNGPRQGLRLREAFITGAGLNQTIEIQVGAINQQNLLNPLLAGDYAFLGSLQKLQISTLIGNLGLTLEEAVPPSTFSLLETAAQERTPGFYLAQVSNELGDEKISNLKIFAGYFAFQNLTTAQARQSLFYGNTVIGNSGSAAFFLPYRGYEGGFKNQFRITPHWSGALTGVAIHNTAAPKGSGTGYFGTLQISKLTDRGSFTWELGYFYDQSDSSPAVFSDAFLISKNHKGSVAGVVYRNEIKQYSLFARWMHSDPLVPQLYTSGNNTFLIGTEVHYDSL